MRTFLLISILVCSIFVTSGSASLNNYENIAQKNVCINPLVVSVNPSTNVKQGQTIFIEVATKYQLINPRIIFDNKKIKVFNEKNGLYRGLVGIDALETPGLHKIVICDDTGKLKEEKCINVISGKFPVQNIVISGSKGGLEPAPGELAKVQRAKSALTDISYWSQSLIPPYSMPTRGCIISVYGLNRYHNGVPTGDFHKGIDIKAPQGQRINTIAGGRIMIAEQLRLHGGTVAVDHGQGVTSVYLHMSKISVKKGQIVKAGQKIGEIGSTGFATGPHLHWGLYVNGTPVNPMEYWIKSVNKCLG